MATVTARIAAFNDDDFPGWATVEIQLADGGAASIGDKTPVLGIEADCRIGDEVGLDCDVLERSNGVVLIRLRHGVSTAADRDILLVHQPAVGDD